MTIPRGTLNAVYVRIEELETKKEDTKRDEGEEEDEGKEKMKKKEEVGDISNEDEVVPIGIILKKKENVEAMVQNSAWEYKDKAIGTHTKWIETRK